jgi:hypothetical protein
MISLKQVYVKDARAVWQVHKFPVTFYEPQNGILYRLSHVLF